MLAVIKIDAVVNCFLHTCFSSLSPGLWLLWGCLMGLPRWVGSKESAYSAGAAEDVSSIPGSGRSPGRGNSNPLQYSCLGNPMDRGAWRATVHGVIKICTELSMHTCVHTHTHTHTIALQCYVSFCCKTWTSGKYTYIPSLWTSLPPRISPQIDSWSPSVVFLSI